MLPLDPTSMGQTSLTAALCGRLGEFLLHWFSNFTTARATALPFGLAKACRPSARAFTYAVVFFAGWLSHAAAVFAAAPGRWAVLVGVNDYAEVAKLEYCVADMQALRDQLVASGFAKDHVFLLSDKAEETRYRPLKANIERQLDLVLQLAAADDLVLIAFSGHGVFLNGKSYLCPNEARLDDADETMVSLEAIYDKLAQCPASLKLFLVDACRNDPRPDGQKSFKATAGAKQFAAALERPPRGILLLTSCNPGQISMEEQKFGHGVFMHYVLEGLRGQADDDKSGSISLVELYRYANRETKTYVARTFNEAQVPALKGDISDDFDISRLEPTPKLPKTITNSIGMSLTLIPAGEFMMGSEESVAEIEQLFGKLSEVAAANAEGEKSHRVRLPHSFYMGTYEVSKSVFARFVEATGYKTDAEKNGKGGWGWIVKHIDEKKQVHTGFFQKPEFSWRQWGVNQSDHSPVVNVSWNDAMAFCKWLGRKEGKKYRLPVEVEWEYACRAGTTTRFASGDDPLSLTRYANVGDQSYVAFWRANNVGTLDGKENYEQDYLQAKDGYALTCPVGRFRPNSFGLYDMHGNAAEWCAEPEDDEERAEQTAVEWLKGLAKLVLDPLVPAVGDARELILSPDSQLWLVPWAALPVEDGKYAVERWQIRYVTSGRDVVLEKMADKARRYSPSRPRIFADPDYNLDGKASEAATRAVLRGKEKELSTRGAVGLSKSRLSPFPRLRETATEAKLITPAITALAHEAPTVYSEQYAQESVLKMVQSPRVLVMSTHGFYFADQEVKRDDNRLSMAGTGDNQHRGAALATEGTPFENPLLRCGLALAGCNKPHGGVAVDDGIVTGMEIVGCDLRGTELVVLSACETGLGDVRNGDGVAGLRQAFQLAGAKAVVSTLWKIPNQETVALMSGFFNNLAAGKSKAEALRATQLAQIKARRRASGAAHPYYWAAFTVTGN